MISILLVDDEPLANQHMQSLLAIFPDVEITGVAENRIEARTCLSARTPDVVFLDVELPGGTAFSLIPEIEDSTQIVFVTAHERHAVEAFAVGAVDYLVKPVTPERLAETLSRLTDRPRAAGADGIDATDRSSPTGASVRTNRRNGESVPSLVIPLRQRGGKAVVRVADICWIESIRNYTRVALRNPPRVVVFRRRLGEWLDDLPEETFARISRSEVIHLGSVTGTEWKSRSETIVFFEKGVAPLTLGRISAVRLGTLLEGHRPDSTE
jgi:two-component system LytT family response regulator